MLHSLANFLLRHSRASLSSSLLCLVNWLLDQWQQEQCELSRLLIGVEAVLNENKEEGGMEMEAERIKQWACLHLSRVNNNLVQTHIYFLTNTCIKCLCCKQKQQKTSTNILNHKCWDYACLIETGLLILIPSFSRGRDPQSDDK